MSTKVVAARQAYDGRPVLGVGCNHGLDSRLAVLLRFSSFVTHHPGGSGFCRSLVGQAARFGAFVQPSFSLVHDHSPTSLANILRWQQLLGEKGIRERFLLAPWQKLVRAGMGYR